MRLSPELKYYIFNHVESLGMQRALKKLQRKLGIDTDMIRWAYNDERRRIYGRRADSKSIV